MGKAHKKASSSAVFSCVAAAIPFPSVKAKQPGIMTASFGAGAIALAADVAKQYEALEKELPFSKKIEKINWAQSFRKAGTQSLIAGISAGVVLYAADHPRFRNFAGKIKKLSYERVEKLLKKSGFSGETAEEFCKRFGVSRVAGNLLDDIYNAQKSIINQWKNAIANASRIRKGNFGEIASDAFLSEKGFQPLHTRLQNIDAPTRQGIDGVLKKGSEYFIVEAKYKGTGTLSILTDGTKQMSDAWISQNNFQRLRDVVGNNLATEIRDSGYKRLLAEIAPDGSVIYKELDVNANILNIFNP